MTLGPRVHNFQKSVPLSAFAKELTSGSIQVARRIRNFDAASREHSVHTTPSLRFIHRKGSAAFRNTRRGSDPSHINSLVQIIRDDMRAVGSTEPLEIPDIRHSVAAEVEISVSLLRGSLIDGDLADFLVTPRIFDQVY